MVDNPELEKTLVTKERRKEFKQFLQEAEEVDSLKALKFFSETEKLYSLEDLEDQRCKAKFLFDRFLNRFSRSGIPISDELREGTREKLQRFLSDNTPPEEAVELQALFYEVRQELKTWFIVSFEYFSESENLTTQLHQQLTTEILTEENENELEKKFENYIEGVVQKKSEEIENKRLSKRKSPIRRGTRTSPGSLRSKSMITTTDHEDGELSPEPARRGHSSPSKRQPLPTAASSMNFWAPLTNPVSAPTLKPDSKSSKHKDSSEKGKEKGRISRSRTPPTREKKMMVSASENVEELSEEKSSRKSSHRGDRARKDRAATISVEKPSHRSPIPDFGGQISPLRPRGDQQPSVQVSSPALLSPRQHKVPPGGSSPALVSATSPRQKSNTEVKTVRKSKPLELGKDDEAPEEDASPNVSGTKREESLKENVSISKENEEKKETGAKPRLSDAMKNYSVKRLQRQQLVQENDTELVWEQFLNVEKPPREKFFRYSFVVINLIKGIKLISKDINGYSDPYCLVTCNFSPRSFKTDIKKVTLNPQWNELCEFDIHPSYFDESGKIIGLPSIKFEVFDYDRLKSDDFMGTNTVELKKLIHLSVSKDDNPFRLKVPLEEDAYNHPGEKVAGHILISVELVKTAGFVKEKTQAKLPVRLLGKSWGKNDTWKMKK